MSNEHDLRVVRQGWKRYVAICSCGFMTPPRKSRRAALRLYESLTASRFKTPARSISSEMTSSTPQR